MDLSLSRAKSVLSAFLDCDPSTDLGLGVNHKMVKSPHQGDLFFSRKTTKAVQEKLKEKVSGGHQKGYPLLEGMLN